MLLAFLLGSNEAHTDPDLMPAFIAERRKQNSFSRPVFTYAMAIPGSKESGKLNI